MDDAQAAQAANEGSIPVSTRPETNKPNPKAKATKWDKAPDVVGEEEGKTGEEEPKGDAKHGSEDAPQTQAVTDTAGTANDAGPQDGDHAQIPAWAENDPLAGAMEPASNTTAPEASAPGDLSPAVAARPLDAAVTGDPAKDAKADLSGKTMFRDDSDHPHFAGAKAQARGDYDKSSGDTDEKTSDKGKALDARAADLDKREAEVTKREQAAQPGSATVSDRDVDAQIVGESYVNGNIAFGADPNLSDPVKEALAKVTLCVLMLRNGGVMIGSAEASGMVSSDLQKLRADAKADARGQLDAAFRYAHRSKLAGI